MSDYDVILGTPETLTTNQYYILRDRVENMLEDGNPLRQTMIASSYRLYNSVPFLLNFLGVRYVPSLTSFLPYYRGCSR